MPSRRRTSGQRAAPKLFHCTGYGNCDMVFTRSEHLARHERKHTGEKPYKCVVPGCSRMFSRFDNMMQHTQTHEKHKKHSTAEKDQTHGHRHSVSNESPVKSESIPWNDHQQLSHPTFEPSSMMSSRTLPLPTRRASFSSYGNMPYPPPPSSYRLSQATPHPYCIDPSMQAHNIPRNRSSWPIKREPYQPNFGYYRPSPPPPPVVQTSFGTEYHSTRRRSSNSTISSDSTILSPAAFDSPPAKRRISIDDLRLPIESLKNIQLDGDKNAYSKIRHNSIAITHDEYEALEGFGKFHKGSIVASERTSSAELTPSPVLKNESPTIAAQVCAMRQRVMTVNESFQRR
ncbi:hypothetical protein EDC94DRAFT_586929 [Helicostylum pulchrum]|uniref:C2H2-type domain-containing protein n=1 Tax=Helicostylum pulchrum TaxID=562976 RepID=A0ABP9Y1S5_9FUNG|nr:hypothetical protein EDC94DRAFT_586929 [Helicostylum pulchrum]